ncbi:hypothetical protein PMKS-004051 [Pichia membranifaciens]|uniref:1-phosphatidylinositol-3-phosphate 5-kinase n=1 Tax=Pichia membranifaciens TaxID=4926 RepID=A0A1Q2YM13_9ASCO|nr:hypothetical protein PMKS-004051 [Pichia membranifaciens]
MTELLDNSRSSSTTHLVSLNSYPSPSILNGADNNDDEANNSNVTENIIANLLHSYTLETDNKRHPKVRDNLSRLKLQNRNESKQSFISELGSSLNLNLGKNANNQVKANTGIGRDYWLDDASAIKCRSCDRKFTTFLRKHHCRICGKIFCSNCTTFINGEKFNHHGKMRVCLLCNNLADRYDDGYCSSDDDDEDEDTYGGNGNGEVVGENNESKNGERKTNNQENSGNSSVSNNNKFGADYNLLSATGNLHGVSTPTPPPMMTIPTTRAGEAVEIDIPKHNQFNATQNNLANSKSNANNSFHNSNDSSEDENEMIPFMNNHQFNWPKSSESLGTNSQNLSIVNKENTNSSGSSSSSTLHFLTKVHSFRSNNALNNNMLNYGKPNRRRIFSNRIKNRKSSRPYTSRISQQNNSNFDNINPDIHFSDDFQKVGEKYASSLLNELLVDKKIENFFQWSKVLTKSLNKINNIEIYLKNVDNSNINSNESNYNFANYIKIKKILGSDLHETKTIEGIVFSKKLPLKTMPTTIKSPKIMLITFPVEYDQDINNKHHFQSLESIIAQQDQYIKKLVDRMLNLKPKIVISSNSVNGLALKIFAEFGISVVPNCKLSNLIKLSKFTNSTIITSIDLLAMKPQIGTCEVFKVLNFQFGNIVKSYLLFDGCPNKIGLTIILRDANDDTLTKVKSCLMIMIYTFTNIKLESSFMRDQCLKVEDHDQIKFIDNINDLAPLYSYDFKSFNDFVSLLNIRLVSTSPWVKFNKPLILVQLEKTKLRIAENQSLYEKFLSDPTDQGLNIKSLLGIDDLKIHDELDLVKLVTAIKLYRESFWQTEMAFYLKKWDQFWRSRELTYFDPNYNQNIAILFSMISKKNSTPCIGPEIQLIDFYWESDFSLGQFIENICLNANNLCNENCQLPLKDHYRSYVHNDGKIDIFIESNSLNVLSNNIMTWSVCKNCLNSTPVLPLNDTSYKYSFGKFLELIFWFNNSFDFKILNNNNNCQCNINNPEFDFFKDYIHYFSFKNYKIHLEYNKIDSLQLIIPKFKLFWNPVYHYNIKLNHFHEVQLKSSNFFDSVNNRLVRIKLDGTDLSPEQVEEGNVNLNKLKEKLLEQRNEINLLLVTMYKESGIQEHLKLNTVLREVQELSSFWNFEFQVFAKDFLPSEKDVKKITAFQLDRLFRSLANKDEDESETESETEENDSLVNAKPTSIEPDLQSDRLGDPDFEQIIDRETKRSGNSNPRKHKSQLILNKIHELNNKKSDKLLWIPPTKALEGGLDAGKVKQLTRFFDTQEYFNQRELEKQKLDNYNKYTPKVSIMKPQIEVYKNASDAVNAEALKNSQQITYNNSNLSLDTMRKNRVNLDINENEIDKGRGKEKEKEKEREREREREKEREKEKEREREREKEKDVQPEKISLLKSLTHFWADRSATLWEPLSYPLDSSEHIFVDSDVIVREDEPSSIIAFCLSTSDYRLKLNSNNLNSTQNEIVVEDDSAEKDDVCVKEPATVDVAENHKLQEAYDNVTNNVGNQPDNVPVAQQGNENNNITAINEIKIGGKVGGTDQKKRNEQLDLEQIMLRKGFHLKYQFEDGYSAISCKIFFAQQFDALRKQCGVNDNFIESLSRCVKWDSTGGKSGSAFLKTSDQRFIIKELSKAELEAFVHFAPSYFEYFAHVLFHDLPSVLVKIFGFYQIQVKNTVSNAKSYTMDILIMENLFYDRKIDRIFDLKGSMRNRHVEQTGKENEVLLDENMVEYIYESPLFVKENDKRLLRASLWNDTLFLEKMNVMDYSLVVGIDHANSELIVGIIDCIRTFTWDKKLESWVKEKGLVGNTGVGKEPTVITPKQYKNRFREAMERYILMAPGVYYQGTTNST